MFNERLFKSALVARGKSVTALAHECDMNPVGLYNRISGKSRFTRDEIERISVAAPFTDQEIIAIFFAKELNCG